MRADPIGLLGGTNLFGFVSDNPIKHSDPNGLAVLVGIGGSAVTVGGLEASTGLVIDPTSQNWKIDVFGSAGSGLGVNVSADVFVGYIKGDATGITKNINIVIPYVSFTTFLDPKTKEILGGTIGVGPSLTPGGSFTLSGTGTIGDLVDIVRKLISKQIASNKLVDSPCK